MPKATKIAALIAIKLLAVAVAAIARVQRTHDRISEADIG